MAFFVRFILYLILCFRTLVSAVIVVRHAVENVAYSEKVETTNAIKISSPVSLRRCTADCNVNDKCVSFFYNDLSLQCVLHSTNFKYTQPGTSDIGWRFFDARDATGRCSSPYVYYRYLDFCYKILDHVRTNFTDMQVMCNLHGGKLAAIESEEKYNYFKLILQNRIHPRVGLGVERLSATWRRLIDGNLLTYFNWAPGQPDMIYDCMQWKNDDLAYDHPCGALAPRVFVCEI